MQSRVCSGHGIKADGENDVRFVSSLDYQTFLSSTPMRGNIRLHQKEISFNSNLGQAKNSRGPLKTYTEGKRERIDFVDAVVFAMEKVAGSRLCAGALLLFLLILGNVEGSVGSGGALWGDGDFMKISSSYSKKTCDGSIGECFPEEEMMMDSEMNRRILATTQYISYGALRADSVPCSKTGTSYYDCGSSGQANPYSKSCTQITRCARDTS